MRIAASAAAIGLLAGGGFAAGAGPQTHTVIIESMRFEPERLTVASGDTIVWVNKDLVPHTATSERGGFDSETIDPDASWTLTVTTKGEFAYLCTAHPSMKAALNVE